MEVWKPVVGYEGLYEVSNEGRVKSLPKYVYKYERILKPGKGSRGAYRIVSLSKDKIKTTHTIHQLVMEAFVGPCPEDMEIDHGDKNTFNNHLDNLEYVTHPENMKRSFKGTNARNGRSLRRFSEDQIKQMRNLHSQGITLRDIAAEFGIKSLESIWLIVNYHSYKDVT